MPKYMISPLSGLEDFDNLQEAIAAAQRQTESYGKESGGFAIFEVKEVGQVQYVSPMWVPAGETLITGLVEQESVMGLDRMTDKN